MIEEGNLLSYVLLTRPRTGSEFLMGLLRAAVGREALSPTSSLTPGRNEKALKGVQKGFSEYAVSLDYFRLNKVRSLKIESPENDDLARHIASDYENIRFLVSFRRFESVAASNHKLSWGRSPRALLQRYERYVTFIEEFRSSNAVYFVDVESKEDFSLPAFKRFLGISKVVDDEFIARWPVINNSSYRISKDGGSDRPAQLSIAPSTAEAAMVLDEKMLSWVAQSNSSGEA